MIWDVKLETGVDRIDNQHRELCRLVDVVLEKGHEKINETIKFLGDYVVQHFADEEALQVASQYPSLPEHKELHTDFIKVFLELKSQLNNAKDDDDREIVIMTINGTVVDWLKNHILVHDKHFSEWYKSYMPS
ncbi:MAG: bacteriohemerythrin [Deltaproteobacteria bacterium]|nr:bacteriohemerythrin [Deltaproteobacteria bacterium]